MTETKSNLKDLLDDNKEVYRIDYLFNTKTATAKKLCKGVFKMLESEVFTTVAGYKKH